MATLFLVIGIISFLTGVGLLFAPRVLIRIGEWLNRVTTIDETVFSKRILFGVFFIGAGLFFLYYYLRF